MKTIDQWIQYICARPESETKGELHYSVARSELDAIQKDATRNFSELKLFVWEGWNPDYSDGLAFAIAKDEKDARKQVSKSFGSAAFLRPQDWGTLKVFPLNKRVAFQVSGGG